MMKIVDIIENLFGKKDNQKLSSVGLEKALETGLITDEEYHYLKIKRHEEALKRILKEELKKK